MNEWRRGMQMLLHSAVLRGYHSVVHSVAADEALHNKALVSISGGHVQQQ